MKRKIAFLFLGLAISGLAVINFQVSIDEDKMSSEISLLDLTVGTKAYSETIPGYYEYLENCPPIFSKPFYFACEWNGGGCDQTNCSD